MMIRVEEKGQLLEVLREELKKHDAKLIAIRVGVTPSTIYAIRRGKTKWPHEATTLAIAHVLGFALYIGRGN